jgi:probable O-glycosylation ligase (exosortase A-associated)
MGILLLYALIAGTAVATLVKPWIGVIAYYVLSVFYPQIIWHWIFSGIRASLIVSSVTVVGFFIHLLLRGIDLSVVKSKQSLYVILLWLSVINSYFNNPYGINPTEIVMYSSDYLLSTFNKIFMFYFVTVFLIRTKHQLHWLLIVLMGCVLYFTYYANMEYISGRVFGRLAGPGIAGVYSDENAFAMTFVVVIPVFYFMGNYYKNWILKLGLWAAIPAAWHAIFLTGSLGGLISLGVVMGFVAFRSKRKLFILLIPAALLFAFLNQGGGYLKEKALGTEGGVTGVETAQTRFESWTAGINMIMEHPVTGVGPGNFLRVYSDYSDTGRSFVAHNTFIQFSSEMGLLAGLMYLLLGWNFLTTYFRHRHYDRQEGFDPFLLAVKESITGGAIGFYTCALFLNLATYEIFYLLLVCKAVLDALTREHLIDQQNPLPEETT